MDKYDYKGQVTESVKSFIKENYDLDEIKSDFYDLTEFRNKIFDEAFDSDSVTGNASGSYYCNRWKAEEAICHNWDLIGEMVDEGFYEFDSESDPETIDVCIRCYVLGEAVDEALDELGIDDDFFEDACSTCPIRHSCKYNI